jgi:hypothetical protein
MWIYRQSTGEFFDPTGALIDKGYSGLGIGKNNYQDQTMIGVGPIPRGSYNIGEAVEGTKLGPYALPLYPTPDHPMFGRSGFYIHADSLNHPGQASEGCIVISTNTRIAIINSHDTKLYVIQ